MVESSDSTKAKGGRQALLRRLENRPDLLDWSELYTSFVDNYVRQVCDSVLLLHPQAPPIAVVATGGYGRRELSPFSDLDITVVPLEETNPALDAAAKDIFRALHSQVAGTLSVEIGYAYRLVNDAPGLDERSRTALLDARLIAGSEEPLDALMKLYWETFPTADFLIAKISERQIMFDKTNDTPLVVEPELKEGAGGLRCFQCANWLRSAMGERPLRRSSSYNRILQLRNLLHLTAHRRQDLLSRQRQAEIADLLRNDVYEMMAECAACAVDLHAEYQLARERLHEARFVLGGGVSAIRGEARMVTEGKLAAASLAISKATQLGLKVPAERFSASPEIDGSEALAALTVGEQAIRNMDRCGLLPQLLPELAACKFLMPRDSAHRYTVYEHTLRAIQILDGISGEHPLAGIKSSLPSLGPLYLALLLHDVGKVNIDRNHSEAGEEIASRICQAWKLDDETREIVPWLVREHLTMARFVGMRDIYNPQTTYEFAALVQEQERLDMLTLLTYCDIKAVSDQTWTPTQETFLMELYERTSLAFEGSTPAPLDSSKNRRRLLHELKTGEDTQKEVEAFLDRMPANYLASTDPSLVGLHMQYEKDARAGQVVIDLQDHTALQVTDVTVCCLDQSGLLSKILGVLYAYDLSLHGLRASTSHADAAVALDVFTTSFGSRSVPRATAAQVLSALRACITGEKSLETILRDRGKDTDRTQRTLNYTFLEGDPSILEVQAPRGRGMAFRLSRLIARHGWNISAARVGQWAGRGAAAFYVSHKDGSHISKAEVAAVMDESVV